MTNMAFWDPIAGEQKDLPWLRLPQGPNHVITLLGWNAAVLCASAASGSDCDHIDCHRGHFTVVFISSSPHHGVYVCVYSSEAGSWTLTASAAQHPVHPFFLCTNDCSTLVGSALHFMVRVRSQGRICRYDLGRQEISWINLPPSCSNYQESGVCLTSTEYGGLVCARLENSRLHLWSREVGSDGILGWAQSRVIEFQTMLPSNTRLTSLAAFVHGVGAFLVRTDDGLLSIDLELNRVAKVCEGKYISNIVPHVSFCIPALAKAFTREEPSAGVSSASRTTYSSS